MADKEHRAVLIRGNLLPSELMQLISLVRSMHDERMRHHADSKPRFEILVVDDNSTLNDTAALLSETLPGFAFRVLPFPNDRKPH